MDDLLNTSEAAERLGLTVRAVQKMIEAGRLEAKRVGRDYVILASALNDIKRKSQAGRPPKAKEEAEKSVAKKRIRKKDQTRLFKTLS
jgi:excisionase family DNA binding protein